jgi:S-DNA-T family DNA segregation ATPase FtsK/SpoIIIE
MKSKGDSRTRAGQAPANKPAAALLSWLLQRHVWGALLTIVGLLTILSLLSLTQGKLSERWSLMLRQMFGLGAYPIALLLLASGVVILLWEVLPSHTPPRWQTIVGLEVAFLSGLGLVHRLGRGDPLALALAGKGGGMVGWLWWQAFVPVLGNVLSVAIMLMIFGTGVALALGSSRHALYQGGRRLLGEAWAKIRDVVDHLQLAIHPSSPLPEVRTQEPEPAFLRPTASSNAQSQPVSKATSAAPVRAPSRNVTRVVPRASESQTRPLAPAAGLPNLDMLVVDQGDKGDDADARMRAQIIEETLEAFGIPVEVLDWHRGPVVTQFDVEPGYVERQDRDGVMRRFKIRVSKILSLSNDLSLALAASPIRIEAPVPGRPVVGIEVPNETKTVVGLRGVLESDVFRKARPPLRLALGRDVSGEPVVADLASMPHLLLAGATGSGKSVCLNAIIASFLFFSPPDQVKLLLVDPKRVELTKYNGIPHLIAPVVMDIEKVIAALRWVTREMERRYEEFAQRGARNISAYNKMAKSKGLELLPRIVVVIDELADMMLAAPDDVERTICRLAQMARATGIHLVIATQRPSVDVVTGLIKANFPARISFAVTSLIDSRVVLDTPGAEKLLGRGDMLFMSPDSPKLQRIQGCYVSDRELDALVAFWRSAAAQVPTEPEAPAPWDDVSAEEDSDDALLQQAIDLVQQHNQASASFLQRHMRIGYPRAARLMDQLQKIGVVGPPEAGGRSRIVLNGTSDSNGDGSTGPDKEAA